MLGLRVPTVNANANLNHNVYAIEQERKLNEELLKDPRYINAVCALAEKKGGLQSNQRKQLPLTPESTNGHALPPSAN